MPRVARTDVGGHAYHVINRAVMRLTIFQSDEDYLLFERLLADTAQETGMRVLAYELMPNHWHLVLYPEHDGDLGIFMHRLTNAHTRKVHARSGTTGTGPLYQGRYKSFLIQNDVHLLAVVKYVERNAVRAKLAAQAEQWRWGSAWVRLCGTPRQRKILAPSPVPLPNRYRSWVNTPELSEELQTIRTSVNKGAPYGKETWVERAVRRYGLAATLRVAGRPRKQ